MRLLVNAIPLLGQESGIGNYTRHISARLCTNPDDFEVSFFYGYLSKKLREPPGNGNGSWLVNLKGLARKGTLPRRIAKKALQWAYMAANLVHPRSWDCYFEPNFVLLPSLKADHAVITIHDFSCFQYPQWHPVERVRYMEKHFWNSVEKATRLITVSNAIKDEAVSRYGLDPAKIAVIPNGVDHSFYYPRPEAEIADLRIRYGLPEEFLLYVGAVEPRKNLYNLVLAHARLPENLRRRFPLFIIGSQGWHNEETLNLIRQQKNYVRILGYAPQPDLPVFYSAASFFAYPSWYEGFGLPVLEAMACGCAVLTSDAPALCELCGDAGVCSHPGDIETMTESLRKLMEDETARSKYQKAAIARAARFSWDQAAANHMRLFGKLA